MLTGRASAAGAAAKTFGRTVAAWGRVQGETMLAMMLPPKAGRVWTSCPSPSMSSPVQSAVNPKRRRAATRGARSRPFGVAPKSSTAGFSLATTAASAVVNPSVV